MRILAERELIHSIENYSVTIVVGETGSGKTTKIPQFLYECGFASPCIALSLPRRVSVLSVAQRIASNLHSYVGTLVGYSIRFDHNCSPEQTRVKVLTDGMLVRETLADPLLSRYSVIMVDDCHERSLYTDTLLGLLKKIRRRRRDLRVVVSSATLEAENLKQFFEDEEPPSQALGGIVFQRT